MLRKAVSLTDGGCERKWFGFLCNLRAYVLKSKDHGNDLHHTFINAHTNTHTHTHNSLYIPSPSLLYFLFFYSVAWHSPVHNVSVVPHAFSLVANTHNCRFCDLPQLCLQLSCNTAPIIKFSTLFHLGCLHV